MSYNIPGGDTGVVAGTDAPSVTPCQGDFLEKLHCDEDSNG